jgi:cytochrome c6
VPLALTGWEIGLLSTAVVFIVLALIASMVVPRSRPEFPSRYLGWFIAGCIVLFVGQMTAVILLAEVGEEHAAAETETETEPTETEPTETETTETETTQTEPTETEPTETETTETEPGETTETTPPPPGGGGDPVAGKEVFLGDSACGSCHTLADAGTSGSIGPNLDESQPPADLVVDRVTNGAGAMPSFSGSLSEQEIQDVAAYVASAAGG